LEVSYLIKIKKIDFLFIIFKNIKNC
jgi:hypothetical protein